VYATAFAAGALLTCAFAPLNLWPLAILCPAQLMWLWEGAAPRRAAWIGFCFGAGTFAFGTPWLYISIHDVAQAPKPPKADAASAAAPTPAAFRRPQSLNFAGVGRNDICPCGSGKRFKNCHGH